MKELTITTTVRCPKEQLFEKEIYGDTIKQWIPNKPIDLANCKKCDHHIKIIQYRDGKPAKVKCVHDDLVQRTQINVLEKALTVMKERGDSGTEVEEALKKLRVAYAKGEG